jgi:hypothetical protein
MHAFALAKRRSDPGQAAAAFVWIGSPGKRIAFVGLPLAMTAPENCSRLQPTGARQRLPDPSSRSVSAKEVTMFPPYRPHIPQSISQIMEVLAFILFESPTFVDRTGYFPQQNIDTVFRQLNDGLVRNRRKLGEERYLKLVEMSDRTRAHFEADQEDETGDARKACLIIREMEDLLRRKARKS